MDTVIDSSMIARRGPDVDAVVLVLNGGSSSLKFGVYRVGTSEKTVLMSGTAEANGDTRADFHASEPLTDQKFLETIDWRDQNDALARIVRLLTQWNIPAVTCIGHRIVHGGPSLRAHCLIDDAVLLKLQASAAFAPLHMPPAIAGVRFAREHFPELPQLACFDTVFHATMNPVARTLPLPEVLRSQGVERYGFHGLSCESIVHQLAGDIPRRLVIAHLGNGSSVTAVLDGRSIDTSMGLTPTGGVVMGTRSGDLDPGLIVYLMREKKFDVEGIETLVNHHSGLLGLSGTAGNMRQLRAAAASDARASLAIEIYCYSVSKQIAAMIVALNGIDGLVFTGGIGENDSRTRSLICGQLAWTGMAVDETRHAKSQNPISVESAHVSVRVLPSEEDERIATHSAALTGSS